MKKTVTKIRVTKKVEEQAQNAIEIFKHELSARTKGLKAMKEYRDQVAEVEEGWREKRWEADAIIEYMEDAHDSKSINSLVEHFAKKGRQNAHERMMSR